MARVPLSATRIRLLSGVPQYNDYKNVRWFNTKREQSSYFAHQSEVYSVSNHNFQKIEGKHYVSIGKHIDELWNVNYLMFQNSSHGNKWFYAFVTHLEYKQANRTDVHIEIDVMQTWQFDFDFKPSFVAREHCKLWNGDGSPVINTLDEGLHYGDEYEVVNTRRLHPYQNILFLVIVMKEANHADPLSESDTKPGVIPTVKGVPQPLSIYVHPFKIGGGDVEFEVMSQSGSGYTNPIYKSDVLHVLRGLTRMEGAVDNVVSIYVTNNIGVDLDVTSQSKPLRFPEDKFEGAHFTDDQTSNFSTIYVKDISSFESIELDFGDKYDGFKSVRESKLLMYPYAKTVIHDMKGNSIEVVNEHVHSNRLKVLASGSLGLSNKVSYGVLDYSNRDMDYIYEEPMSMLHSLIDTDPNDLPILDDNLSAFLQGNRNSLKQQKTQALWSGIMGGAQGGISGASFGASSMYGARHGGEVWQSFGKVAGAIGAVSSGVSVIQGLGDAVLAIQSINAKQKDIDNTPANVSNMGGNAYFDFGNNLTGVYATKYQITGEYRRKLTHFFNMFGYKIHEVKVPNLRTRTGWNYVQTEGANIHGSIPGDELYRVKEVFDRGVTLWHINDIGNYNLSNGERG